LRGRDGDGGHRGCDDGLLGGGVCRQQGAQAVVFGLESGDLVGGGGVWHRCVDRGASGERGGVVAPGDFDALLDEGFAVGVGSEQPVFLKMIDRGERVAHVLLVEQAEFEVGFGGVVEAAFVEHFFKLADGFLVAALALKFLGAAVAGFVQLGCLGRGVVEAVAAGGEKQGGEREKEQAGSCQAGFHLVA